MQWLASLSFNVYYLVRRLRLPLFFANDVQLAYDGAMEFSIIKQYFSGLGASVPKEVELAIGDDAAIWSPGAGHHIMSVDTAVAGVHFPVDANWYDIAYRAVGCAASDLAAMAAKPAFATLAVTLPNHGVKQLEALSQGLDAALKHAGLALIGGDTTSGSHLVITLTVHGWSDTPVRRSTAREGDLVMVSGPTGLASAALTMLDDAQCPQSWWQAYWRPQGRFDLLSAVAQYANSCIDISDGLLADLQHICQASAVNAEIDADLIDTSWREHLAQQQAIQLALTGGDDYQLLCTVSPTNEVAMHAAGFHSIGKLTAGDGQVSAHSQGQALQFSQLGYQHQS